MLIYKLFPRSFMKLFGTDGIRGKANTYPMTSEVALQVGKAVAHVVQDSCTAHARHKVVIAKDTRLSGYMIETALTSGLVAMGVDVLLVGPLPTPALAHLTRSLNADAGIMLTASHNPAGDNGIKIFNKDGFKISDEVQDHIEKHVLNQNINSEHVNGVNIGKAYRIDDARGRYIEFAKSSIKSMSLNGLKIVLDCANGAAYHIAPDILKELGAEVIAVNNSPDGLNINKDCGAMHPELIQSLVKKHGADIGIALDGDADRIIICDEKGDILDGDHILAISALDLKKFNKLSGDAVAATVMANKGFIKAMKDNNIQVILTQVGDRSLAEEMKKNKVVLGGEPSGHIIFANFATTGDGVITALKILRIMKQQDIKVSELARCMVKYPQVLVNVDVKDKPDISSLKAQSKIKEVEAYLGEEGRVLVRYSGTEPLCRIMVEGKDDSQIRAYAQEIADMIKGEIGK